MKKFLTILVTLTIFSSSSQLSIGAQKTSAKAPKCIVYQDFETGFSWCELAGYTHEKKFYVDGRGYSVNFFKPNSHMSDFIVSSEEYTPDFWKQFTKGKKMKFGIYSGYVSTYMGNDNQGYNQFIFTVNKRIYFISFVGDTINTQKFKTILQNFKTIKIKSGLLQSETNIVLSFFETLRAFKTGTDQASIGDVKTMETIKYFTTSSFYDKRYPDGLITLTSVQTGKGQEYFNDIEIIRMLDLNSDECSAVLFAPTHYHFSCPTNQSRTSFVSKISIDFVDENGRWRIDDMSQHGESQSFNSGSNLSHKFTLFQSSYMNNVMFPSRYLVEKIEKFVNSSPEGLKYALLTTSKIGFENGLVVYTVDKPEKEQTIRNIMAQRHVFNVTVNSTPFIINDLTQYDFEYNGVSSNDGGKTITACLTIRNSKESIVKHLINSNPIDIKTISLALDSSAVYTFSLVDSWVYDGIWCANTPRHNANVDALQSMNNYFLFPNPLN